MAVKSEVRGRRLNSCPLHIRIPLSLKQRIDELASASNRSMNNMVEVLLLDAVESFEQAMGVPASVSEEPT